MGFNPSNRRGSIYRALRALGSTGLSKIIQHISVYNIFEHRGLPRCRHNTRGYFARALSSQTSPAALGSGGSERCRSTALCRSDRDPERSEVSHGGGGGRAVRERRAPAAPAGPSVPRAGLCHRRALEGRAGGDRLPQSLCGGRKLLRVA